MNPLKYLVGALLILVASAAAAKDSTVLGTIETLDPEVGVIVLRVPLSYEAKSFNLSRPDLPVTNALGRALKLADLEAKDRVALTVGDNGDVSAIRSDADCIWGWLSKLDLKEGVAHVRFGTSQRTFGLADKAAAVVDGQRVNLTEFAADRAFKGVLSSDGKQLVQIHVGKGIIAKSPYGKLVHQNGVLVKADHGRKRLHIVTLPKEFQPQEYEYEAWAEVRLIHSSYVLRTIDIKSLQPFCKVNFHVESDTDKIVQATAEAPILLRRRVEKVERNERRLTLSIDKKPMTYPVAADAMIRTPQGLASWDNVADGDLVTCGLSLDRREIIYVYIWAK